jgi:hypothetical protein
LFFSPALPLVSRISKKTDTKIIKSPKTPLNSRRGMKAVVSAPKIAPGIVAAENSKADL